MVTLAPLPSAISPSRISTFTDCPRLFQYQSIERLESPPTIWTLKGTLVHSALEALFAKPPLERSVEAALQGLTDAVASEEGVEGLAAIGLDGVERDRFLRDADTLVHKYFELEDPTTIEAIGVELKVDTTLTSPRDGSEVHLRGIIDRLDRDPDGSLVVVDYKTGRAPAPGRERARLAAVETYALLCERAMGERPSRVRLLYLAAPLVIERTIGAPELSRQERRTVEVWHAIGRAYASGSFKPSPGPLCRFCAFTDRCEAAPKDLVARSAAAQSS
jgi:putative RecB family exonuclease